MLFAYVEWQFKTSAFISFDAIYLRIINNSVNPFLCVGTVNYVFFAYVIKSFEIYVTLNTDDCVLKHCKCDGRESAGRFHQQTAGLI